MTAFELDLARGTIRSRRCEVPPATVSRINYRAVGRSGSWIQLWAAGARRFVRLAPAGSLSAEPGVDQWVGLRHLLRPHLGAPARLVAEPRGAPVPRWAVNIVDAHPAWLAAGHRQGSQHAPIRARFGKAVVLRATQWRGGQPPRPDPQPRVQGVGPFDPGRRFGIPIFVTSTTLMNA